MACYLMFKHLVYWKYQYNKYMFNFIDIYILIPVSGCVGRVPVHCFARRSIMLLRRPCPLPGQFSEGFVHCPVARQITFSTPLIEGGLRLHVYVAMEPLFVEVYCTVAAVYGEGGP